MNYWDNGEWDNNTLINTFNTLSSTDIIGWQIPDEVLLFTKIIVSNTTNELNKTSFIQIFP